MINEEKLFGNLFDEKEITPERLYAFGKAVLIALGLNNPGNIYNIIIALLQNSLPALGDEIGIVDTSLGIQITSTKHVVSDMVGFKAYMSDNYSVIAKALGGKDDARMAQFYPHLITEYTNATQSEMETLTNRVNVAAVNNSAALGVTLTAELQSFYIPWIKAKEFQNIQLKTVSASRDTRNSNFTNLGLDLTQAVHTVAANNSGKVKICGTYFSFTTLYPHGKQLALILSGTIPMAGIKMIDNRLFTDSMNIYTKNTSINADCFVYMAAADGDAPTAVGKKLKATKGSSKAPSKYGDLANTFLQIKNLSLVNEVTYIVKIKY